MRVELNIGLKHPNGEHALKTIENLIQNTEGPALVHVRQERSSTEETAVVSLSWWYRPARFLAPTVYGMCLALDQEAIAVYFPDTHEGQIIGPQAEKWGDFDAEQFIRY